MAGRKQSSSVAVRRVQSQTEALAIPVDAAARTAVLVRDQFRKSWDPDKKGWWIEAHDGPRFVPAVFSGTRRLVPVAALKAAISGDTK